MIASALKLLVLIPAGFIAAAAIAHPAVTEVPVSYADLNLSTSIGQKMLAQRINAAANLACSVDANERDLKMIAAYKRCHADAVANAQSAVTAAQATVLASR